MFGDGKYLANRGEEKKKKLLERENIWLAEEKKNGEGKGGKCWIFDLVWLP